MYEALVKQLEPYSKGSLTTVEVAQVLGVSRNTVEKMLDEGKLHSFPLNPGESRIHSRVPKASLIAFMMNKSYTNEKAGNEE